LQMNARSAQRYQLAAEEREARREAHCEAQLAALTVKLEATADGQHLDSCRRTMSYVRRTTSYPYDVVRGARTT
jgi:hypothetical protein